MKAQDIMAAASRELNDPGQVRWTAEMLLSWVNEGLLRIALARPDATAATVVMQCAPGTRQEIPAPGLRLLDVVRNVAPAGDIPGGPVRLAARSMLDECYPAWHAADGGGEADLFTHDPRNPKVFYISPPAGTTAPGRLEIVVSNAPAPCAAPESDVALDDVYSGPVLDWVLYRAFMVDTDSGASSQRAAHHFQAFSQGLATKAQADALAAPGREP